MSNTSRRFRITDFDTADRPSAYLFRAVGVTAEGERILFHRGRGGWTFGLLAEDGASLCEMLFAREDHSAPEKIAVATVIELGAPTLDFSPDALLPTAVRWHDVAAVRRLLDAGADLNRVPPVIHHKLAAGAMGRVALVLADIGIVRVCSALATTVQRIYASNTKRPYRSPVEVVQKLAAPESTEAAQFQRSYIADEVECDLSDIADYRAIRQLLRERGAVEPADYFKAVREHRFEAAAEFLEAGLPSDILTPSGVPLLAERQAANDEVAVRWLLAHGAKDRFRPHDSALRGTSGFHAESARI